MQVKLEQINKTFFSLRGRIEALQNINLEIRHGEFFILLGPSGCGKSTLLNIIAGLEKNTGGKIYFGERLMADGESRFFTEAGTRNIAFVFQNYALYPHLNVFHNIAFPLKIAKEDKHRIAAGVQHAAERLDIANLLSAKPAELSGGQRQRVAIARAIVRQPNVFLLDEPLSNLDARLRSTMRAELKELQRNLGTTTVYVTHDQTEAMALGQRIALMKQGRIQQVGSPEELYFQPRNIFAAKFIGSPPMNFIPATIVQRNQQIAMQCGNFAMQLPAARQVSLEKSDQREFELGFRPEDIEMRLSTEAAGSVNGLPAKVQAVEPLGRETFIHLKLEGRDIIAISGNQEERPQTGREVLIIPDMNRIHAFKKAEDDAEADNLFL